jgi:cell division protein ZapA
MMSEGKRTATIQLLDKNYQVDCPLDQVLNLQEAAIYLDSRLTECSRVVKQSTQIRLILMTALNISHELIVAKKNNAEYVKTMSARIKVLQNKIDEVMTKQQEIDLETE